MEIQKNADELKKKQLINRAVVTVAIFHDIATTGIMSQY